MRESIPTRSTTSTRTVRLLLSATPPRRASSSSHSERRRRARHRSPRRRGRPVTASEPAAPSRRSFRPSRFATGSCRRRSTTRSKTPSATSTTFRTSRATLTCASRCRTRSALVGTTRRSSSSASRSSRAVAAERWATFDCYGTLIDWNGGIRRELVRVFGEERADAQLARYHEVEPALQADGERTYREVMTAAMAQLGAPGGEEAGLAAALPSWEPCPEAPAALEEARARGWKLGVLSNTDRDLIESSRAQTGVPC